MLLLMVNILYIIIIFKYDLLNNKDKLYSGLLFSIFPTDKFPSHPNDKFPHFSPLIRVPPHPP